MFALFKKMGPHVCSAKANGICNFCLAPFLREPSCLLFMFLSVN